MKSLLDVYSLKARVFPAFLTLLPAAVALTAWASFASIPETALLGLGANAVIGFFVAERVRDVGKLKEKLLWSSWGGPPTTQLLRHRNLDLGKDIRAGWHRSLEKITGLALPTSASESRSPQQADAAYESAVFQLREKTRDVDRYPLVFKENVSYGFRRNLLALKPVGLILSVCALFASLAKVLTDIYNGFGVTLHPSMALLSCTFIAVSWIMVVNSDWVRTSAFEYAKRLLGASLLLAEPRTP